MKEQTTIVEIPGRNDLRFEVFGNLVLWHRAPFDIAATVGLSTRIADSHADGVRWAKAEARRMSEKGLDTSAPVSENAGSGPTLTLK